MRALAILLLASASASACVHSTDCSPHHSKRLYSALEESLFDESITVAEEKPAPPAVLPRAVPDDEPLYNENIAPQEADPAPPLTTTTTRTSTLLLTSTATLTNACATTYANATRAAPTYGNLTAPTDTMGGKAAPTAQFTGKAPGVSADAAGAMVLAFVGLLWAL